MKGELEELGEDTDENVENLSKMQGQIFNLTGGHTNIFDSNGEFKSTYDILNSIAEVWDDISDTNQAELLETVAGKHRANDIASLLQNWENVKKMKDSALNSDGSAAAEQEKYMQSMQGHLDQLTASWQAFSTSTMDSGFLNGIVDGGRAAVETFTGLINTIGVLPTLLGTISAALSFKNTGIFTLNKDVDGLIPKMQILNNDVKDLPKMFKYAGDTIGSFFGKDMSESSFGKKHDAAFSKVTENIEKSRSALAAFNADVANGTAPIQAWQNHFADGEESIKRLIKRQIDLNNVSKETNGITEEMVTKLANLDAISRSAEDKSLSSKKSIIDRFNDPKQLKDMGVNQLEYAAAIEKTDKSLGKYLTSYAKVNEERAKQRSSLKESGSATALVDSAGIKNAEASIAGYTRSLVAAKAATMALRVASIAANAALTMGVSFLISAAIEGISSYINRASELADKIDDVTTSHKQQREELVKNKSDFEDLAKSYVELSKGVDEKTGKNVSLMPDEYEKYQEVVNQIAGMTPSLVSGYDSQGNAILNCAGNVDTLTDAYNNLIIAENNSLLNGDGKDYKGLSDIADDFQNDYKKIEKEYGENSNSLGSDDKSVLEKILGDSDINEEKAREYTDSVVGSAHKIGQALKDEIEKQNIQLEGVDLPGDFSTSETYSKFIAEVRKQHPEVVKSVLSNYTSEVDSAMNEATQETREAISAYLENAFLSDDYKNIDEKTQGVLNSIVSGLSGETVKNIIGDKTGDDAKAAITGWADDLLSTFDNLDTGVRDKLTSAFDLSSEFSKGDMSLGEYKKQLEEAEKIIDSLNVDDNTKNQLKLSLNVDDVKSQYDSLKNRLETDEKIKMKPELAEDFVDSLSSSELAAAQELIIDGNIDWKGKSPDDIKKEIQDLAKLTEAMRFTIDIETETDGLDKVNTALAESKTATGLTTESIDALKSRYKDLAGYNVASLFEETANGIRLNSSEYQKLEQQYASGKLKEADSQLATLKSRYDELDGSIKNCSDASQMSAMVTEQENIRQQINNVAELAAQYEGLASKFNAWQNVESAGSDRDMYESVLSGFDSVKEELDRGWLDDGSKAFIDMFVPDGTVLNSIDDYKAKWDSLDEKIKGTSYSVRDFFTKNEEGASTNDGVYNFLDAVDQLGKGNIKRDENGEIVSFDFGVNGDKAIADAMGISEEMVQIIERASEDAGFTINMDGAYTSLADLQNRAMTANEALIKMGKTTTTFKFNESTKEGVKSQLDSAKELLDSDQFKVDGKFNIKTEGAQEALTIAQTLQAQWDNLNKPAYMSIDVSQVDDVIKEPIKNLQEFDKLSSQKHQMELAGADTSEVDKSMDEIVSKLEGLEPEVKTRLGIDNLSEDELKSKLENDEITIPAELDIQAKMDSKLGVLVDQALHDAGIIDDEEYKKRLKVYVDADADADKSEESGEEAGEAAGEAAKKSFKERVKDWGQELAKEGKSLTAAQNDRLTKFANNDKNSYVNDFNEDEQTRVIKFVGDWSEIDKYTQEEQQAVVEYVAKNPDFLKDLNEDEQKVAIDFVAKNKNILDDLKLDEGQRKVVVDFVAKNKDVLKGLNEDQKKIAIDLIVNNPDVLKDLDDGEKTLAINFIAKNKEFYDDLGTKEREIVVDLVAKNPGILDGLEDNQKKIVVDYAAENPDFLKDLDGDQKKIAVDFVVENKEILDTLDLDEGQRKVVVDFVAKNKDVLKGLDDVDKTVAINFIAKNKDFLDKLGDDEKQVAVKLAVKNPGIFNDLNDDEKQVAVKFVADTNIVDSYEPEELTAIVNFIKNSSDVDSYTPAEKQAIAKYAVDGGDVNSYQPADRAAIVKFLTNSADPDNYTPEQKQAIAKFLKDSGEVDGYQPGQKEAIARFRKDSSEPDSYQPANKSANAIYTASMTPYTPPTLYGTIKYTVQTVASGLKNLFGGGGVDGTAHANGTAYANGTAGKAFAQGNWGTKENGVALGGELGTELLVRNGRWYTIGEDSAEFFGYKKGDIIFNADQTREIFEKGKITHGNGRGRALADGTAFSSGSGGLGRASSSKKKSSSSSSKKSSSGSSSKSSGSSKSSSSGSSDEADKFEEQIDWIEIAIDRIERAISRLDLKATSVFKGWTERTSALNDQISQTTKEISLQESAYNRYMQEANKVGLSENYASKVRDGTIDIETITDEDLNDKISDYKNWYEKALDCKDAIDELKESEAELIKQRFENVSTKYEGALGVIQHEKDMLDEFVSQTEEKGYIVSTKYYEALTANAQKNITKLEQQKAEMLKELQNAMSSGTITKGSEAWYDMVNSVDEVTKSIEELKTSTLEYANSIREVKWDVFDKMQDQISNVADEANFLIDLMDNKKLFEDNGQLTDEGMATMGLHGTNYNTYMYQADRYAEELKRIQAELNKDPYNQNLIDRRQELLEAQQEAIKNAEDEKNAIKDLVEQGIEKELDSLQDLIDKYNDALDSQKDLYDYQKKVKDQTKEIASLEKQIAAYQNDSSEEAKAKIQQIKVDLEEAKSDLEETEYDQYISDQQKMLDNLYDEYETILNARLDNIDALMNDMIVKINENGDKIGQTITDSANNVGYEITDAMATIWSSGNGSVSNVISTYGDDFTSKLTTTNFALNTINTNLQNMITQLNKLAGTDVKSASTSSAANSKEANTEKYVPPPPAPSTSNDENKSISVGGQINAGSATIYADSEGHGGGRQYYRNDPIYTVLSERNGYILARHHSLARGYTGWFKKGDVSAYKTGVEDLIADQLAWTQENGAEMIVRPSDGAILTPLAQGDSVLTAAASKNIWDMANNPADFIKGSLGIDAANAPITNSGNVNYTQNLDKIVFNLPNVKNYEQLLTSMQKDKNFERLITSMTIDRVAGKSALAKGKAIR